MGYEVDLLAVGEGERSGDAIALRFGDLMCGDPDKQRVVVIDGGFQASGEELVGHIKNYYRTDRVDLAVSTHPDEDHASGLTVVLEELDVRCLWMHRPWNHAAGIAKALGDGRITGEGIRKELRKSLETARDLENLAMRKGIPIVEPFAGVRDKTGQVIVLGPRREYYESLLPEFVDKDQGSAASILYKAVIGARGAVAGVIAKVLERWELETLSDDGETTAQNNSSVVLLVTVGDECLLFTADAGIPALTNVADLVEDAGLDLSRMKLVQVPHHGSRRNVGPTILDRILGPRQPERKKLRNAVVSVAKEAGAKHPSKRVTNAFLRRGAPVTPTGGNTIRFGVGAPDRGWPPVESLPFFDEVEED